MDTAALSHLADQFPRSPSESAAPGSGYGRVRPRPENLSAREAFDQFFGEVFYGQMLKALRSTEQPSAYFHGGRAEEVFRGQLDQMLASEMATSGAHTMTDEMFDVFSQFQRAA